MKLGKVTGSVTMTKKADCFDREKILLVVMSHAAGRYSMEAPSDAVVVAVVEN